MSTPKKSIALLLAGNDDHSDDDGGSASESGADLMKQLASALRSNDYEKSYRKFCLLVEHAGDESYDDASKDDGEDI